MGGLGFLLTRENRREPTQAVEQDLSNRAGEEIIERSKQNGNAQHGTRPSRR